MSNPEEIERAVELVTRAVEQAPGRRLPGAALGLLLRREHRELLHTEKLTKFLDRYATRLTLVGRAGDDLLWGLDRDDDAPWVDVDDLLVKDPVFAGPDPALVSLDRVALFHYRSIRDAELVLDPLTVLVGPNGAGKSNLLDGVFRGVQLTRQKPESVFEGLHAVDRVSRRDGGRDGFSMALTGTDGSSFRFDHGASPQERFTVRSGETSKRLPSLLLTPFAQAFGPAVRLSLHAETLAEPTFSEEEEPYLRPDGRYLPSVLDHLAGSDRARLEQIIERVRHLVPRVEDIRTPRRRIQITEWEVLRIDREEVRRPIVREVMGNALEVKVRGSGWTPADQLSEGTLLVIGLHTMLARAVPPKLVLIDDVDRALHPNAQRRLIEQLLKLASPFCKVIATSHSPFVLDPLPPSAVRLVQLDAADATRVGRLTDHPEWEKWDGAMTPAEFWQYAGDDWLAGAE